MDIPTLSACIPRTDNTITSWLGRKVLKTLGWKITGTFPELPQFVIAVAPHTSNWDFVIGIAFKLALNLRLKFMGKKAIFIWPFKGVLESLGGIAIDRNAKHGVVEQMVQQFQQQQQLILAIAPEGTRKKTSHWKSGFLQIAHQANIPVVPVSFDFEKKEIQVYGPISISNDIPAELVKFKQCFIGVCAKNPQAVDI